MLKKSFFLIVLAAVVVACATPTEGSPPAETSDRTDSGIGFTFANPAGALTYAETVPASDAEKVIRDMDVFMFLSDGSFARKLTAEVDFKEDRDPPAGTSTLTLTNGLLAQYVGKSAFFYFVANNTASTGGVHISSFSGTMDEFKELLTQPLPASPYFAGKVVNVTTNYGAGGLLMTGKSGLVYLGGRKSETVPLTHRVARFDIHNPKVAEGIRIDNIYISDAKTQGTLFGNSSAVHSIDVNSTEVVWGPDPGDYDAEGYCRSAFYLYPTDLATTRITIEVANTDDMVMLFELDRADLIEANKRYTLIFDGDDLTVGADGGNDWGEGGTP